MRNLYQVILFYVLLPTWYSLRVDLSDIEVCEEDGVEEDLVSPAFDDPLLLWVVYFLALLQQRHFLPDAALILLLRFWQFCLRF